MIKANIILQRVVELMFNLNLSLFGGLGVGILHLSEACMDSMRVSPDFIKEVLSRKKKKRFAFDYVK
jgi:hypothetical protein